MTQGLHGTTAMVIGGSSGLGKATVATLIANGAFVIAVARGKERLNIMKQEFPDIEVAAGDATDATFIDAILRDKKPDLVVLTAGVPPTMAPIDAFSWHAFSDPWDQDVKSAFNVVQAALRNLKPHSTVVVVSSGAAVDGSPLSGSYAGAKRMQWFLAEYAQMRSDEENLGIRFRVILPRPIKDTTIGLNAAAAYGGKRGMTADQFLGRIGVSPTTVARVIVEVFQGGGSVDGLALVVGQQGAEAV